MKELYTPHDGISTIISRGGRVVPVMLDFEPTVGDMITFEASLKEDMSNLLDVIYPFFISQITRQEFDSIYDKQLFCDNFLECIKKKAKLDSQYYQSLKRTA